MALNSGLIHFPDFKKLLLGVIIVCLLILSVKSIVSANNTPPSTPPTTPPPAPPSTQPSFYGYYDASVKLCNGVNSSQATLSNPSDQAAFDAGAGVPGITGGSAVTLYKGGHFYCCADQMYRNTIPVANCTGVQAAGTATDPWFSSSQADANLVLAVLTPRVPVGGYFSTNPRQASRSEFLYSAFNNPSTPSGQLSNQGDTILGYSDSFFNTPVASNFGTDWFGYLQKLVEVNLANVDPNNKIVDLTAATLSDTITIANSAVIRKGDLSVNSNARCNSRTIIFVEGNLTIAPPFRIFNRDIAQQLGCLFVVKGNVTITAGSAGTKTVGTTSSDQTVYDNLELGIIANDVVTANYDSTQGLYIKGFLAGGLGKINRDTNKANAPSFWVDYDPRFIELFRQELKLLKFSTREKGFVSSL